MRGPSAWVLSDPGSGCQKPEFCVKSLQILAQIIYRRENSDGHVHRAHFVCDYCDHEDCFLLLRSSVDFALLPHVSNLPIIIAFLLLRDAANDNVCGSMKEGREMP